MGNYFNTSLLVGILGFLLEFTFNSKNLIYSPSAFLRNIYENMTFVIGKLNFVSYQFAFRLIFSLRPKKPFGLRNVATYM